MALGVKANNCAGLEIAVFAGSNMLMNSNGNCRIPAQTMGGLAETYDARLLPAMICCW